VGSGRQLWCNSVERVEKKSQKFGERKQMERRRSGRRRRKKLVGARTWRFG
jgi:hypothetical protein